MISKARIRPTLPCRCRRCHRSCRRRPIEGSPFVTIAVIAADSPPRLVPFGHAFTLGANAKGVGNVTVGGDGWPGPPLTRGAACPGAASAGPYGGAWERRQCH